jgi:hypothetical protein
MAILMDVSIAFIRCCLGFLEWIDNGVFVYDDRYVFAYDKDTGLYIPLYKDLYTYKTGRRIYLMWAPTPPVFGS